MLQEGANVGGRVVGRSEVSKGVERVEACVPAHIHSKQAAVLADLTRRKRKKKGFFKNRLFRRKKKRKEKAKAGWNL